MRADPKNVPQGTVGAFNRYNRSDCGESHLGLRQLVHIH